MPASQRERKCYCTPCSRHPQGYRTLKYTAHRDHELQERVRNIQRESEAGRSAAAPLNGPGQAIAIDPRQIPLAAPNFDVHRSDDEVIGYQTPPLRVDTPPLDFGGTPEQPGLLLPLTRPPSPALSDPGNLPQAPLEGHSDDSDSAASSEDELPGVFSDPPCLRLAYFNAMCDHIVRKHPVDDVETTLRNTLNALRLCGGIPDDTTPRTTLKSIRCHLGLSSTSLMRRMPVCSECYKPYTSEEVANAELPATCTRREPLPACTGVYMKLENRLGNSVRRPAKSVWYIKIVPWLRRMFKRPSFVRLLAEGKALSQVEHDPTVMYDISDGSAWKNARIGLRRIYCQDGTVVDEPIAPGSNIAVSDLGYGLFAGINLDWFRITKKRSSGAIYMSILNIPRHARYDMHNVLLACVIPGPNEPKLENLNFVLNPVVDSFKKLYAGVAVKVYNENLPHIVHLCLLCGGYDVPARSKAQGLPAHNRHHRFGCDCDCCLADVNKQKGYAPEQWEYIDERDILRLSKEATLSEEARTRIANDYGIRWSALNELPGWMPHGSAPFDPMHGLYLGITAHFWSEVIEHGKLLGPGQAGLFDECMSSLTWPSQIGRLSSPLSGSLNRKKADELRRLASVLPFLLWISWRQEDNSIQLNAPDIPAQTANKPKFQRNCQVVWECSVFLTAALRLFTSWIAYLPDIDRAQNYLRFFCEHLLWLKVGLVPNHHFAMHLPQYFRSFGPCSAWWLFAYERFNGCLEKVENNGHPDDIDTSMCYWWARLHALHDLLEHLPKDASDDERVVLNQISASYVDRGTLLAMTQSVYGGEAVLKASKVPRRFVDLRALDDIGTIYHAVLNFACSTWPHHDFISDLDFENPIGRFFPSARVARPLHSVHRNSWRYGCAASSKGSSDQYALALIDGARVPVKILRHLSIDVSGEEPVICSVIARFCAADLPALPWDLYAEDLGYYVVVDDFMPVQAISPRQLVSPVVTCSFELHADERQLRFIAAYDKVGHEIFEDGGGFDEHVGENV